jgi:transposase-like protein
MVMRAKFYPDELKLEAVRLVIEKRFSAAQAGTQLGIPHAAVGVWVRRYRESRVHTLAMKTHDIQKLRLLLKQLAVERDEVARIASRLLAKVV